MELSITSDYCTCKGSPEKPLRLIAEAGFTHLHWCHHFSDDFLYTSSEITAAKQLMKEVGLKLLDVHGSTGQEKSWSSLVEYERLAGVELVKNRARLFTELGGSGHLIMHIPCIQEHTTEDAKAHQRQRHERLIRSLDELVPWLQAEGIPLALENMSDDTWELLEKTVARYPAPAVGICYDSGHGNFPQPQLDKLRRNRFRLTALHLNDNDGAHDLHQSPFLGTVDWETLTGILADSSHQGVQTFEITMRDNPFRAEFLPGTTTSITDLAQQPSENQLAFLKDAFQRCSRVAAAIAAKRSALSSK